MQNHNGTSLEVDLSHFFSGHLEGQFVSFFMALGIYQVTQRWQFLSVCLSVGPGFGSLGTSRYVRTMKFGRRIRDQARLN